VFELNPFLTEECNLSGKIQTSIGRPCWTRFELCVEAFIDVTRSHYNDPFEYGNRLEAKSLPEGTIEFRKLPTGQRSVPFCLTPISMLAESSFENKSTLLDLLRALPL
jgi:hypothetical protein